MRDVSVVDILDLFNRTSHCTSAGITKIIIIIIIQRKAERNNKKKEENGGISGGTETEMAESMEIDSDGRIVRYNNNSQSRGCCTAMADATPHTEK